MPQGSSPVKDRTIVPIAEANSSGLPYSSVFIPSIEGLHAVFFVLPNDQKKLIKVGAVCSTLWWNHFAVCVPNFIIRDLLSSGSRTHKDMHVREATYTLGFRRIHKVHPFPFATSVTFFQNFYNI